MKIYHSYLIATYFFVSGCKQVIKESPVDFQNTAFKETYLPPVFSDSTRLEKIKSAFPAIDEIFKSHFEKGHFPGMSYGLIVDGKLMYSNSFGLSNMKALTKATTKTGFRIASMSKSFTAMAILRLRDEGKLRLTDPVSNHISEMKSVKNLTKDSPVITIENLLTMSAGFPEDNPWGDRQLADTEEELLKLISDGISFSNSPGLQYEYSNLNFGMLGRIVTVVSGKPFQQYINEEIIRPLEMNDTKWEFTEVPKEQLALGYRWEDNTFKEEPILHDGIFGAMGGLICSVEDFSKYVAFHLSAWPPRNEDESSVIKRSSLREMHQLKRFGALLSNSKTITGEVCPTIAGYGYGLGHRRDCNGTVAVRHGGGLPGYGSEWRFYPDYGIGIVSLSNLTYGGLGVPNSRALDTLVYLAKLTPRTLPVSVILKQRQHEIIELITRWPENKLNLLAENFLLDHSLDSWKKSTSSIFDETGALIKVHAVIPENQLRGTFIIECEKKNIKVFFTLTPEQNPLLQQLDLTVVAK